MSTKAIEELISKQKSLYAQVHNSTLLLSSIGIGVGFSISEINNGSNSGYAVIKFNEHADAHNLISAALQKHHNNLVQDYEKITNKIAAITALLEVGDFLPEYDVLDVGFLDVEGVYTPPELNWREDLKQFHEEGESLTPTQL